MKLQSLLVIFVIIIIENTGRETLT